MLQDNFVKSNPVFDAQDKVIIEKARELGYENLRYVITEKVSGTNVQVSYDGEKYSISLADSNIDNDKVEKLVNNYKVNIRRMYLDFVSEGYHVDKLVIIGKLFGGKYTKHTSKGVNQALYTQGIRGSVFDICLVKDGKETYLDSSSLILSCTNYFIPVVPFLAVTESLTDAINYKNNGESQVYKRFNLPKIEGNEMDGIIIKPAYVNKFINGDRFILKSNNKEV